MELLTAFRVPNVSHQRIEIINILGTSTKLRSEKSEEKIPLEDLGVNERIILKLILNIYDIRMWNRNVWFKG
jgi:hypothetical protein